MTALPTMLTKAQAAALLCVSTRTIDNYCKSRVLSFYVLPRGKRFALDEIKSFLASRLVSHRHPPSSSLHANHNKSGYVQ